MAKVIYEFSNSNCYPINKIMLSQIYLPPQKMIYSIICVANIVLFDFMNNIFLIKEGDIKYLRFISPIFHSNFCELG